MHYRTTCIYSLNSIHIYLYGICDNITLTFHSKYGAFFSVVRKRMKKNEMMVLCNSSGMVQLNKMTPLHKSVGLYTYKLFGTP